MARNYPANTQLQCFYTEAYNKERDTRLGWFFKQQQCQSAGAAKSRQYEVFKKKVLEGAPRPAGGLVGRKLPPPKQHHKRKMNNDDTLLKLSNTNPDKLMLAMRPSTPTTREYLYDGFTKEGKGRYRYLQQRYRHIPENKYEFPLTSSWEYGWRLSDVIKKEDIKKPQFGRTRIVADTFYTRTGIPGPTTLERSVTVL